MSIRIWPDEIIAQSADSFIPFDDPEVREDVEQQLELNLEAIRKRYALFVSHLFDSITAKGVSVESLRIYLLGLPALECDDDDENHKLLSGARVQLKKAATLKEIFIALHDCGSFLNYDVFQCILNKYEITDESNSEVLKYSEHLKAYLDQHKLSEFIKLNPSLETVMDPSKKKLILKFDIALPMRVTKVLDLKKAVAKILGLRTPALRLVGIEEGCVVVTFLIPAFVADLTPGQLKDFNALPVLHLSCGDQVVVFGRHFYNTDALKRCSNLTILYLESSLIDDDDAKALAEGLKHCPNLQMLNLGHNHIHDGGAEAIADGLKHCPNLQTLNLWHNYVHDSVAKLIKHCPNLQALNLGHNCIHDDGAKAIADGLKHCPNLQALNLGWNNIGHSGTRSLADGLKHCPNLRSLKLGRNYIRDDGAKAIADGLKHCPNLQTLNLGWNSIGDNGAKALAC